MTVPKRRMGYYQLEVDGKIVELPSVTTILRVIDKPALIQWAAKQGALAVLTNPEKYDTPEKAAAAIYDIQDTATSRGGKAHEVAEAYASFYEAGMPDKFTSDDPYFPAIKAFFETMHPEILYKEVRLVNLEQGYAGTADLIARVGPKSFVVDFKTGKAVYPEARLQVEAYRQCTMLIKGDGTRVSIYPMADAGAVVLLRDDGTFAWTETTADHTAFLAAMILFLWQKSLR